MPDDQGEQNKADFLAATTAALIGPDAELVLVRDELAASQGRLRGPSEEWIDPSYNLPTNTGGVE